MGEEAGNPTVEGLGGPAGLSQAAVSYLAANRRWAEPEGLRRFPRLFPRFSSL